MFPRLILARGTAHRDTKLIVVDFPDPDWPMTATNVPRSTVTVTPWSAFTLMSPS